MGIAPTGKQVTLSGMMIDRIVNGKIVEEWEEWDSLGMMRQLGVVPPAAKGEAKVAA
jgi:predicted ester cyclase